MEEDFQFRPENYTDYLINEVGFNSHHELGVPKEEGKGNDYIVLSYNYNNIFCTLRLCSSSCLVCKVMNNKLLRINPVTFTMAKKGHVQHNLLSFFFSLFQMSTRKVALTLFSSSTCSLCTTAKAAIVNVQKKVRLVSTLKLS